MPIPEIYTEMIDDLTTSSNLGNVVWKAQDESEYYVRLADYRFCIWEGVTDDDYERHFVAAGLRELSSPQLLDSFSCRQGEDGYEVLVELLGSARRSANKVRERIHELARILKSGKRIGD